MKVICIGDIHGTTKWIDCYRQILEKDNDCEKIIVMGDWFDPYSDIPLDIMIERYNEFLKDQKEDNRIVSLLGNHDLDGYVIDGETNRTARNREQRKQISDAVKSNLDNSYLVYKIGNWLFSHAGVSQTWLDDLAQINQEYPNMILSNKKGWSVEDLDIICHFSPYDYSYYGDSPHQGCTWIRPQSLVNSNIKGYNQVVGHTRIEKITNLKDIESLKLDEDIWIVDNEGKPEYLVLDIDNVE